MARKKLDLFALDPKAKRASQEEPFLEQTKTEKRYPKRGGTAAAISRPRRGGIERTADRLADFGVPRAITEGIKAADRELLGFDATAQSIRNIQRDEGTGEDYFNVALMTPLAGVATKPFEFGVKRLGRGAANVGRRALTSRPGRYLTEARPLADAADDTLQAALSARPVAQRRITNQRPVVRGLPAPEQRLGLPAPGPGLPDWAAKAPGGEWWPDRDIDGLQLSPENAVRNGLYLGERFSSDPLDRALTVWVDRAIPRYLKTEFATPEDPLRTYAPGALPGVGSPEDWSRAAKQAIMVDRVGNITLPPWRGGGGRDPRVGDPGEIERRMAMPWLAKKPVTDPIYGIKPRDVENLQLKHVVDEMRNALRADTAGIPADLAVRPESLARMSFPQAVERVGRINQWRAKQAEQAQLSAMNSPAVQMFKEYPDDPRGLRWVELRAPELGDELPEGYRIEEDPDMYLNSPGYAVFEGSKQLTSEMDKQRALDFIRNDYYRPQLQEALRYEGDTMGHCVGGYCDDVLSGRSRIFSLRDAKGEPHVTIETGRNLPGRNWDGLRHQLDDDASDAAYDAAMQALESRGDTALFDAEGNLNQFGNAELNREMDIFAHGWLSKNGPEDIVQIKGKQNRAPKEDYLPYVQDFVKSGQWGEIGDLANTGLVNLPDGRLITRQQMDEGLGRARERHFGLTEADLRYDTRDNPEAWAAYAPYFEGFARGGRVQNLAAKPCSCDKSLAVR